jgi:hypothetical protein
MVSPTSISGISRREIWDSPDRRLALAWYLCDWNSDCDLILYQDFDRSERNVQTEGASKMPNEARIRVLLAINELKGLRQRVSELEQSESVN